MVSGISDEEDLTLSGAVLNKPLIMQLIDCASPLCSRAGIACAYEVVFGSCGRVFPLLCPAAL